jgi:hypothetical protein
MYVCFLAQEERNTHTMNTKLIQCVPTRVVVIEAIDSGFAVDFDTVEKDLLLH